MKKILAALLLVVVLSAAAFAEDIILPEPDKTGGIGVLDAISASTLLWVAGGINREDGRLTYATASNFQDMVIYAFTSKAVYKYNPEKHSVTVIAEGDYRKLTGGQPFVAKAAVDLLYIQDTEKWPASRRSNSAVILNCGYAHAGLSMQNVYLYAASLGWGARTRMNFDREGLTKLLGLTDKHNFTLMQCVGPKP